MTIGALPLLWLALGQVAPAAAPDAPPTARVKADFLALLDRPRVAPDVRAEAPAAVEDGLSVERFSFASQARADGGVERVPTLLVKPAGDAPGTRRPAVIVLHGTGGSKDRMRDWLDAIARRGMIGVAIDARYHGDRVGGAAGPIAYLAAITRAWRTPEGSPREHPFYYDTCWDLWRTLDVLSARPDVDPDRLAASRPGSPPRPTTA
jgi:hypothetical protein